MKKRILSFFLAIISTFSLVVPVFATNTQLSNNPDKVISTIDYTHLQRLHSQQRP